MKKIAVILGTSRPNGNTTSLVEILKENDTNDQCHTFDLHDYNYSYFHYENENKEDDFLPLIEEILKFDIILFVTPVYWYAMSAQMKVFFDRLSDLLTIRKDLGRTLKGKHTYLLAHGGTDSELPEGFEIPFKRTSEYFDMIYLDSHYLQFKGDDINQKQIDDLKLFYNKIFASSR